MKGRKDEKLDRRVSVGMKNGVKGRNGKERRGVRVTGECGEWSEKEERGVQK